MGFAVVVAAIGAHISPKRWLEMNPGGRRHPKKSWVGRGGRKVVEKLSKRKVLRMGFSVVENLSGLQESIFSLSRRP